MAITDLTGYTWVGNSTISITGVDIDEQWAIDYSVYNPEMDEIDNSCFFIIVNEGEYSPPDSGRFLNIVFVSSITGIDAYADNYGWIDERCRTITITGGTDVTNSTLIAWLEANGTLQNGATPTPSTTNKISIGAIPLAKAFIGDAEVSSMWLGNVKIYEKEATPAPNPYLTFSSANTFTLGTSNSTKSWDGALQYSTDTTTWNTWDGTSAISSSSTGTTKYLYLRGTGNSYITGSTSTTAYWVLTGTDIDCTGNIENLLDYETVANGQHPTMDTYCFRGLFKDCTSLTTAPELPATTLANNCYQSMFRGCTALTTAPSLPATTLAQGCYTQMFYDCTSLTTALELPATTLANNCYYGMFLGCTALTTIPSLPATTLAQGCYNSMFLDCTALTTAPSLPATTLANLCYQSMFRGCTALTTAPSLPATTLTQSCYYQMFSNCTALTTAPSLPATTLAQSCYNSMFLGCTALTTIPSLPATTLAQSCYNSMFSYCTNIKLSTTRKGTYQIPYRIPKTGIGTTATSALNGMFTGTGGTFTGTPSIHTTYYTSNTLV